jgi:hypothetical protein
MTYLWLFHYAIIQKLANKRFKSFPDQMALSAFTLLCLLFVALFAIFVDKNWLFSLYENSPRLPLGPIVRNFLLVLALPFYIFLSSKLLKKNNLKKIRKSVFFKNNIKRVYSMIYVGFIFFLFILGVVFIFISFPIY